MPQKRRDFRKRQRPNNGPWETIKFLMTLAVLGVVAFVVGALVISRLMLPASPAKDNNGTPSPRTTSATRLPASAPRDTTTTAEPDTIVEQGTTRRASDRTPVTNVTPDSPLEPRHVVSPDSDTSDRSVRPDPPRRASAPEPPPPTRREPRRATTRPDETPRTRAAEPEPRRSDSTRPSGVRTSSPPRREPDRREPKKSEPEHRVEPPTRQPERRPEPERRADPPRISKPERSGGGIQRGETIPD